jgi:hypothetical protein
MEGTLPCEATMGERARRGEVVAVGWRAIGATIRLLQ